MELFAHLQVLEVHRSCWVFMWAYLFDKIEIAFNTDLQQKQESRPKTILAKIIIVRLFVPGKDIRSSGDEIRDDQHEQMKHGGLIRKENENENVIVHEAFPSKYVLEPPQWPTCWSVFLGLAPTDRLRRVGSSASAVSFGQRSWCHLGPCWAISLHRAVS